MGSRTATAVRTAILSLAGLAAAPAFAYRFTPVTAVASATQTQESTGGVAAASDALSGFGGGFLWETPLSERYGLELGAFYLQRKFGSTLVSNGFSSIQFPVQLRANFGNFSLGAGGFFTNDLGSLKVKDLNGTVTRTYPEAQLKTIEAGVMGSAGLIIPWSTTAGLLFEGRYLRGLTNNSTAPNTTLRFADFQFMLGLTFGTRFSYTPNLVE